MVSFISSGKTAIEPGDANVSRVEKTASWRGSPTLVNAQCLVTAAVEVAEAAKHDMVPAGTVAGAAQGRHTFQPVRRVVAQRVIADAQRR